MFTRKEYLAASMEPGSFSRYYGEIIAEAGGAQAFARRLPVPLDEIKAAFAAGDEHLNTIPLRKWDTHATHSAAAAKALRDRGDYPTLGNGVCILKEAARLLATATHETEA